MSQRNPVAPKDGPPDWMNVGWFSGLVDLGQQVILDGFFDMRIMGPDDGGGGENDEPSEPNWPILPNWPQCLDDEIMAHCNLSIELIEYRARLLDAFMEVFCEACYTHMDWVIAQCCVDPKLSALANKTDLNHGDLGELIANAVSLIANLGEHLADLAWMLSNLSWTLSQLGGPINDQLCHAQCVVESLLEVQEGLSQQANFMDLHLVHDESPEQALAVDGGMSDWGGWTYP